MIVNESQSVVRSLKSVTEDCMSTIKGSLKHDHLLLLVICLGAISVGLLIALTAVLVRGNQSCSDLKDDLKSPNNPTPQSVTSAISTPKPIPCTGDWIWNRGKCYYFSDLLDTWTNSERFCASQNASLTRIDNADELKFLNKFKGNGNSWIGLKWSSDNNGWTWTDGTLYTGELFSIQSASANSDKSEGVFLNDIGVKSQNGKYEKKWICARSSLHWSNMESI
ncbi:C-type lectin domain family 2 member A-like [Mixophyes fleayi]|uniref:C-type lectin domain family 2 member A-like n=1 Tax=Mixophyes fleayi TaxID=3061075 RepID=UPI003F4D94A0